MWKGFLEAHMKQMGIGMKGIDVRRLEVTGRDTVAV
jgi:NACalpha-BTF3-like transcription factor